MNDDEFHRVGPLGLRPGRDDDHTNERIEKYGDPSASNHVASSGAVDRTNKLTEKYADPSESNHVASNDAEYSTDYSRDS